MTMDVVEDVVVVVVVQKLAGTMPSTGDESVDAKLVRVWAVGEVGLCCC